MWSDNETTEDLLGFKVHADLIIDVIKDDKVLPVTIGVFGDWGSGKSSIMKIIQEELSKLEDGTFVLYFNGWVFEGYDDAKAALLESIIKAFSDNKKFGSKVKDQTQKLLKSVKWMRVLGFGFKNIVLPTTTAYFTGGLSLLPFLAQSLAKVNPKDLAENLQGEKAEEYLKSFIKEKDQNDETILVREFRDDFTEMIEKSKIKKLVVLIDDLDRCTPDRIIENLEAIKLFLNVSKTAFIIGADPRIVRHAIEHRYNAKIEESNDRIVDDYLEKLIQIPYYLPKLSDSEVETYVSLLVAKSVFKEDTFNTVLESFQKYRIDNKFSVFGFANIKEFLRTEEVNLLSNQLILIPTLSSIITQGLYGNPRQIKRFLNTFILRKRLADVAKIRDFKDTILAKLMILEYSEPKLFMQLYEWQLRQDGIPIEIKALEDGCIDRTWQDAKRELDKTDYKIWIKEKIIKWLSIEPNLQNIDLRDYFWLSRDKITSSLTGSSLIPPIVKIIFNELNQDLTKSVRDEIITTKVIKLTESEFISFLEMLKQVLKKNPKEDKYHFIFHTLIDMKIIYAPVYYKEALGNVTPKEISPAIGMALKSYNIHPELGEFLQKYFNKDKSPSSIAFNLEVK